MWVPTCRHNWPCTGGWRATYATATGAGDSNCENGMSAHTDRYLTQFQAANDAMIAFVTACDDEDWQRLSTNEGWTVAAIAHHVAVRNGFAAGMIRRLIGGSSEVLRMSPTELHAENAIHAQEFASVSRLETLDLLHTNGELFVQSLQLIDSEELLDRTAEIFDGRELSVAFLIENVVIGHCANHLDSIRATIAG
jgi:hypothetical protein